MKFRPCIDIHNGQVKQIVGGSLLDVGDQAEENFVSTMGAESYAEIYKKAGIWGGHIIILNPVGSPYYEEDYKQAISALERFPLGLQVGGGITPENALDFLNHGASHVIVTSYVFQNGIVDLDRLKKLHQVTASEGRSRLVLDLSCRKKDGEYYIVTNRWQTFTNVKVTTETLDELAIYCDEFLIHAVDVEGKASGIEKELVKQLGEWNKLPITYAGGVGSFDDLKDLRELGQSRLDVTIGSALNLFGGDMEFDQVLKYCQMD